MLEFLAGCQSLRSLADSEMPLEQERSASMRVIITTQVFPPEIHPTAVMAGQLAEDLAEAGWSVFVACGRPHHPTGRVPKEYEGHLFEKRVLSKGVEVRRLWHPTSQNRSLSSRMVVMATQMLATAASAVSVRRPDVVISFGGPPLLGPVLSGVVAKSHRVPVISVLHDIYPDVASDTQRINPVVLSAAHWLERVQYALSDYLVVLGPQSRELLVKRGVDSRKIELIPVWLDPKEITPSDFRTDWRRELGIDQGQFVVLYSGTVGIVSGAEILADVAKTLPPGAIVVVVGGGSAWEQLRQRLKLEPSLRQRLIVVPFQDRSRLNDVQASSNLSIVTLAPGRGRTSVPSKVQGYMAAGRPVLASVDVDSDTAELVRRGSFGFVTTPGDAKAIVDMIRHAMQQPEASVKMGQRAREVFEAEFSRRAQTRRFVELMTKAVRNSRQRGSDTT